MQVNQAIYRKLQRHLNRQAVGFPSNASGYDVKILMHIFTPHQAEIAMCLTYQPAPIHAIFSRAQGLIASEGELQNVLEQMLKNGGVESSIKDHKTYYCLVPLVVGMYEYQNQRLTPEFIHDFNEYSNAPKFGMAFLSTELPQMRTIPIQKSIKPHYQVSLFDEVEELIQNAHGPFVIVECICRKKKEYEGQTCKVTKRKETCLAMNGLAQSALRSQLGREITKDEAFQILEKNQKEGLVLQPSNSAEPDFICSCCGCCCGMLNVFQRLPRPLNFWATNFHATVQKDACNGCGVCVKRCQVGAIHVSAKSKKALCERHKCIGCGICVPTCPQKALALLKTAKETRPPQTRESLYDIIMTRKKGPLKKIMVAGKLLIDVIRTGNVGLLMPFTKKN